MLQARLRDALAARYESGFAALVEILAAGGLDPWRRWVA